MEAATLRRIPAILVSLLIVCAVVADPAPPPTARAQVSVVAFASDAGPPAYRPPEDLHGRFATFRPMLRSISEARLVDLGLEFGLTHGRLTALQQDKLRPVLADLYEQIARDPAWRDVPSCLAFCFDDHLPPRSGQYVMIVPPGADAGTPVIVFLHGGAGNTQAPLFLLARHMPEAIILAPSWTGSWRNGSPAYVQDMLADARQRLGFELDRPTLVGLSDGATAAFRVLVRQPQGYRRMISLAMSPAQSVVGQLPEGVPVMMINGTRDDRVGIGGARLRARAMEARLDDFRLVELDSDHFFLLTEPAGTFAAIRAFVLGDAADLPLRD